MSSNNTGTIRERLWRLPWRLVWLFVFLAGVTCWAVSLPEDTGRAYRALLINFMFFAPLATGMVTWSAVVTAARGRWSGPVQSTALAAASFAPIALAALALLAAGYQHWAAWTFPKFQPLHQGAWLDPKFVFIRDLAGLAFLSLLAWWYARRRQRSRPGALSGVLVLAYCLVWTLLGFDLVMALDPHWYSLLFGAYIFITGMYAAVAAWTLAALFRKLVDPDRMQDLGKLIVTFSLLATYCMFSQLLVIWYENLPQEVTFVIPRLRLAPDKTYSYILLGVVYLGPLVLLLTRWAKRTAWFLGLVSLLLLAGLWLERWWLITPTILGTSAPLQIGLSEVGMTAAFLGAFCLLLTGADRRLEKTVDFEEIEQA